MNNFLRSGMFLAIIAFSLPLTAVNATWIDGDFKGPGVPQKPKTASYTNTNTRALGIGLTSLGATAKPRAMIHAEYGNNFMPKGALNVGSKNKTNATLSSTIGNNLVNPHMNSLVVGQFNDPVTQSNGQKSPIFSIGTGQESNRKNALVVTKEDYLGLGTNTPSEKLHITNGQIRYEDGSQANGRVLTSDSNGVASWKSLNVLPNCVDQEMILRT